MLVECFIYEDVLCEATPSSSVFTSPVLTLLFLFQIGADGRRNQVFLALSTAAEFREHLTQFSDFYSNLGKLGGWVQALIKP